MDTLILIALVLIPFVGGILVGWGLRSLLSLKRRGVASAKGHEPVAIDPAKPNLLSFSREQINAVPVSARHEKSTRVSRESD